MFPHVNLCPLLESHLRGCAETKGLITPDAAHRGGGGVLRGEDRSTPRTWGNGQLLLCWSTFFFFFLFFFPPPAFNISLHETLRPPTRAGAARARGNLAKFSPLRGVLLPPGWGRGRLCGAERGPGAPPGWSCRAPPRGRALPRFLGPALGRDASRRRGHELCGNFVPSQIKTRGFRVSDLRSGSRIPRSRCVRVLRAHNKVEIPQGFGWDVIESIYVIEIIKSSPYLLV